MYFLVEDDDLLEKYNTIWDEVRADIKKEFDNEPVYNKNDLKTNKISWRSQLLSTSFFKSVNILRKK